MKNDGKELIKLRKEVNKITMQIFKLIYKRQKLCYKIGLLKKEMKLKIRNKNVEEKLKMEILEYCKKHGLRESFCLKILNSLILESIKEQKKVFSIKKGR
ncbi:MAG: chorismate mutase [Nitrososphaerota archaeon]